MKKGKQHYIEPTHKCLFHCPDYHLNICPKGEKDPKQCKHLVSYSVCCPACREPKKGMRKYYDELYMKFTCENCGQWFSITWPDENISKKE